MKRNLVQLSLVIAAGLVFAGLSGARAPFQVNKTGTALLVLSTDCPVAMRYTPRINALYEKYTPRGIDFVAVFPNDLETKRGIEQYRAERSYAFPCQLDLGANRAKKEGVTVLPTLIVLDKNGQKVYQGAIDDSKELSQVKRRYAEEALDAVLSGTKPKTARTEAFGCVLMPSAIPPSESEVTYAEHVAPILNAHCVECHRPNEVAPFSLMDYASAKKWAPMIEIATSGRRMPPWKAVHGFGDFKDENVLTEVQIETLKRWNKAGAPRGKSDREPVPPVAASPWPLGEPDLILKPVQPYKLGADGDDVYRHFVLKTDYKETRYVKAMAVRPDNARVVHHVIAFLDSKGVSHRRDGEDGQPGYDTAGGGPGFIPDGSFGGWAPGLRAQRTAPGVAFELKPRTSIVLQVHYHKSGKPETDQTQIGLYFAKEPIEKIMNLAWLANPLFRIPAGAESHKVQFDYPVPADATLHSVMPHMHLLGKSMKAQLVHKDGTLQPLIYIDDWDFNWQLNYMFKEPVKVPAGSKIRVEAIYDNSKKNPRNPNDPPKPVTWGEQTTDEMFLLVAAYTLDGSRSARPRQMGFSGGG